MGTSGSKQKGGKYDKRVVSAVESQTPRSIASPPLHEGSLLSVSHIAGDRIAVCSDDKCISVVDSGKLREEGQYRPQYLKGHSKSVSLCRSGGSTSICWSVGRDLSVIQWNLETGEATWTIPDAHSLNITGLAISSGSGDNRIFTGSRDYSVKCWDTSTRAMIAKYEVPRNIVTTLQLSPTDPHTLYQGSEDLFVRIWDTRTSSNSPPASIISGYVYFPVSMDVSSDGNLLATGCKGFDSVGCTVKVWDVRNTSQVLAELSGAHSQDVVGCQFLNNSSILSASKEGSTSVWDFKVKPDTAQVQFSTGQHLTALSCAQQFGEYTERKMDFALSCNNGSLLLMSLIDDCVVSIDHTTSPYFHNDDA